MHLTSTEIQAYANERLAELQHRADKYRQQALAQPDFRRAMVLARMIDALGEEAAHLSIVTASLCARCGDWAASDSIHGTWNAVSSELVAAAGAARAAGLPLPHIGILTDTKLRKPTPAAMQ